MNFQIPGYTPRGLSSVCASFSVSLSMSLKLREIVCVSHRVTRSIHDRAPPLSLPLSRPGILPRLSISMAERTPKRTIDSTEVDVSLRRLRHSADVSTNKTAGGVQSGRRQRKRRELEIMLYHWYTFVPRWVGLGTTLNWPMMIAPIIVSLNSLKHPWPEAKFSHSSRNLLAYCM